MGNFLPFYTSPLKNPKNQNFEKMKKIAWAIIILLICTKNHNHMRYGSWDREWERHYFFVILVVFCPFTPLTTQKIKLLKKWKTHMKISSFYICVPKITIIWYMLPVIWVQHTIFCHFGSFFALLPLYWPPKIKNREKIRRYFLFRMCTINKDSWDIRRNRQKFSSFWVIFCPFIPLTNQKIKFLKNEKKPLKILSFYICLPWMTILWCMVP